MNEGAEINMDFDPFAHIDLSILEMVASGSRMDDLNGQSSRFTPTSVSSAQTPDLQSVGQEVLSIQHINEIGRAHV